jgi:hypothetical protein
MLAYNLIAKKKFKYLGFTFDVGDEFNPYILGLSDFDVKTIYGDLIVFGKVELMFQQVVKRNGCVLDMMHGKIIREYAEITKEKVRDASKVIVSETGAVRIEKKEKPKKIGTSKKGIIKPHKRIANKDKKRAEGIKGKCVKSVESSRNE